MENEEQVGSPWLVDRVTKVWVLLLGLTALSWWVGFDNGAARVAAGRYGGSVMIILAFVKIRLVIAYFMKVREAPILLRALLDIWIVGLGGTILILHQHSMA